MWLIITCFIHLIFFLSFNRSIFLQASSVLKNEEGAITFYVLNANAPAKSEGGDKKGNFFNDILWN